MRRHHPAHLRALRGLFDVAVSDPRFTEARDHLDRIRRFNPQAPYLAHWEARCLAAPKRYSEALAALDRLEAAGGRGAEAVLLYHGLGESDWGDVPSVRRLREHLTALRDAGYGLVAAHELPAVLGSASLPSGRTGCRSGWSA